MEIVNDFDERSYNNNGKTWKSSRILRVNPNFFMFLSFSIVFLHFLSSFSFFNFLSFFHVLSFSIVFYHFLSFSVVVFCWWRWCCRLGESVPASLDCWTAVAICSSGVEGG